MGASTTVLLVAVVYLGLCLWLGWTPAKRASSSATGYVAGDRAMGLLLMYFITGATIFSAFAFLGAPGRAYSRGASAFFILAFGVFGFLPFYFLGPRAARLGRAYGFVTQAQMVSARFGSPAIAGVMALLSIAAFLPYLALQMKGAGIVLNAVSGGAVSVELGAAIVYSVVTAYVLRSGVLGVGWTNTFQGVVMMVLAWGLGLWLPRHLYGGVGEMFLAIQAERPEMLVPPGLAADGSPWTWGEFSSAIVVSAIGFSFWPHLFMKAFSAKDDRTIRRTVVLYPTFQIFLVPLFLIGFAGVLFASAPAEPDQILPHMLMNLDIPPLVVGLFCAGALAASMSSGDAMAHAGASIAVRDGVGGALRVELSPERERRWIRVAVVAVMVLAYPVAVLFRGDLVLLLVTTYGAVVQFAPAVTAALYWRRATGPGVLAGLLAGVAVTVWLTLWPSMRPVEIHAGTFGLLANVVALAGVSLARPAREGDGRAFLETASGGR